MMNKFSIIIFFLFCTYNAQKKITPKKPVVKPVLKTNYKLACGVSGVNFKKIDNWYNEKYVNDKISPYNFKKSKSIKKVKEQYSFKKDQLFHSGKKVDSLLVYYRQSENINYLVYIVNGMSTGYTINANNNPQPSMYSVTYNKDGDITYNYLESNVFLAKGSGSFKGYYYAEWNGKNQSFSKEILKEEGEVKNNYKVGEWKYYNNEGKIDSVKTYTLKDAVDVRFPQCIFNKNEPCY
ncbi:hypothetical protein C1631_012980 [Chryseobacterium phosphatilyticum]|uniref:MORN repeat variant n=1 Tax=Chryseobacterium phosphatilyticum TaxID=475075 RepID=A0A316X6Y7_9FLAO|nr:hypothetical protein [Chryseobacterium phosphatilyticum]PWN68979.1 hypothetical protein C1631_012980 [Chryseobacterium phosphatilyticum]